MTSSLSLYAARSLVWIHLAVEISSAIFSESESNLWLCLIRIKVLAPYVTRPQNGKFLLGRPHVCPKRKSSSPSGPINKDAVKERAPIPARVWVLPLIEALVDALKGFHWNLPYCFFAAF